MADATQTTRFRFWLWLIRIVGVIVPRRLRADWRQEWESELRYRETLLAEWDRIGWRARFALLWHGLGAFMDALWLQPRRMEDEMFQDLRFGARMLQKSKGAAAVAILSLALGIGANTAIFSMIDALLLKPLPVKQPERLVFLEGLRLAHPDPVFRELSEKNTVFDGLFSFHSIEMTMSDGDQAERVMGELVSGNFFTALGVSPHLGRVFSDADDQTPGAHFVTVISYNFWRRRFGADPQIVGKKISVNNYPFTIIGVAAQGFNDVEVGVSPDLRVPMMMKSQMLDYIDSTPVMARLKPGVSVGQAQIATDALYQNIIRQNNLRTSGDSSPSERVFASRIQLQSAETGVSDLRGQFSQSLILLMCLVGVVLLIACLNVANLLLARAVTRRHEIAVRLAIGAGRLRLARQLLTEGFLLSALGGLLGLVFARWGTNALLGFLPQNATLEIKLDWRMLGFTLGVTVLTALLFGLAPALQATRFDMIPALKNDAAGAAGGRRGWGLRRSLVVLQVAMTFVLLVSGALFARSLRNLRAVDHGYTADQIVTMEFAPVRSGYKLDQQLNFYTQLSERVTALPGVKSLTFLSLLPFSDISTEGEINVPGYQSRPNERPTAQINAIAPQFFATFGIPLLTGRDFNAQDSTGTPKAIIVNNSFARYFFGDQNPLGKRISVGPFNLEIVGVAGDAKLWNLKETMSRTIYYALEQRHIGLRKLCVRAPGDAGALVAAIRHEVRSLDPNMPVFNIKTFADQIDESIRQERLIAMLSSFFGFFALLLAALGLYGVMAHAVARRTREIGVRMALGAQAPAVLWMVMRETLLLVFVGVAIGLPVALGATRLIKGLLFGLGANDPLTIALSVLAMLAVAALAGYLPARRAASIDPMTVLRHE
jgi:predicted permease